MTDRRFQKEQWIMWVGIRSCWAEVSCLAYGERCLDDCTKIVYKNSRSILLKSMLYFSYL